MLSHIQYCDPRDYSPPGSSVYGIFQARIIEWVAVSSPGKDEEYLDNSNCVSLSISGISKSIFKIINFWVRVCYFNFSMRCLLLWDHQSSRWKCVWTLLRVKYCAFFQWTSMIEHLCCWNLCWPSQGRRSLVGCRLRGRTESDTTEVT